MARRQRRINSRPSLWQRQALGDQMLEDSRARRRINGSNDELFGTLHVGV